MATPRAARPSTPVPAIHPRLRVVVGDETAMAIHVPGFAVAGWLFPGGSRATAIRDLGVAFAVQWFLCSAALLGVLALRRRCWAGR